MSDDKIALHPMGHIPLSALEPNAEIVKYLEAVLEKARNGQIQAVALCFVDRTGVPEAFNDSARGAFHPLQSGVAVMQARMMRQYLDDN